MKAKKFRLSLLIIVILIAVIFSFFTRINPINATTLVIQRNHTDMKKEKANYNIINTDIVANINRILTSRVYYKQPIIDSWSRSVIEYELEIIEERKDGFIKYRILLNENESEDTRLAYQSRLDVIHSDKYQSILNPDFSVRLDDIQVLELINILKETNQY